MKYIEENETRIIKEYQDDPKGLAIDYSEGKVYIKYFEYPMKENASIFGRFANTNIFTIASSLLMGPVYLKASRYIRDAHMEQRYRHIKTTHTMD